MIKEVSTCSYLMVINTPRLCNDVAFMPSQENKAHTISCRHILAESEIPAYTKAKMLETEAAEKAAAEAQALADARKKETEEAGVKGADEPGSLIAALLNAFDTQHPDRPGRKANYGPVNIGGTELGAQQLVGKDGRTIEKGAVAGGKVKEVYVATVATSDGKQLSKEEMRKLEIYNPKEVEGYKKQLRKMSQGRPWKLELVDTPTGREFRAYIDPDDKDDKDSKQKTGKQKNDGAGKRPTDGGGGGGGGAAGNDGGDREGSEETYKDEL
jgi:protein OS-9